MTTPAHIIDCTRKIRLTSNVFEIAFTKPKEFHFIPGQFLLFDIPLMINESDIQPRAFSIGSAPSEDELLFVIKLKEGGRASEWIEKKVEKGTSVRAVGPLGLFTITPVEQMHYVFIATGAGIAPFRSQVKWLLTEHGWTGPLDLIFGVRSEGDWFWVEEFQRLAEHHKNFHLHLTLTAPEKSWNGKTGRVQTILPSVLTDPARTHIYICGAPEMVNDTKKFCIEQLHIEKKQVHAEGYI